MFLDPRKPLEGCRTASCDGCPAGHDLHCHFRPADWLNFMFISLPPFLIGGAGIYRSSGWLLLPWLSFAIAYFGLIEIRVMCAHCPHYAEATPSLRCWANYGSPKWWRYRPGPMNLVEKIVFLGGFVVIWGYPPIVLLTTAQLYLLLVYTVTTSGFFMTMSRFMCTRCINFACPLNRVDQPGRDAFFDANPTVAQAWGNLKEIKDDAREK